ncbi:hypothetical protein ASPWEDRAFT_34989, partial [Aspergillus wentii DTO 134E9]
MIDVTAAVRWAPQSVHPRQLFFYACATASDIIAAVHQIVHLLNHLQLTTAFGQSLQGPFVESCQAKM